ncbi:hypothetical protein QTP88_007407 [Uroleucon formosanum]
MHWDATHKRKVLYEFYMPNQSTMLRWWMPVAGKWEWKILVKSQINKNLRPLEANQNIFRGDKHRI